MLRRGNNRAKRDQFTRREIQKGPTLVTVSVSGCAQRVSRTLGSLRDDDWGTTRLCLSKSIPNGTGYHKIIQLMGCRVLDGGEGWTLENVFH